jgi:hypothetical protein
VVFFLVMIGAVLLACASAAGLLVFFAARTAIRRGRQAKEVLTSKAAALGVGEGAEAERLRQRLRQEVARTRQAVDEAGRRGWQVGELPERIHEVTGVADRLDAQLAVFAKGSRGTMSPAGPSAPSADGADIVRLRAGVSRLVDACADMRSALLRSDVELQEQHLDEVVNRARIEAESLRAPSALDRPVLPPELESDDTGR